MRVTTPATPRPRQPRRHEQPAATRSTSSTGTSERTSYPSAVGRTQRRPPAACFLSIASAAMTVVERVGERLRRQAKRVEQRLDPPAPVRRRHAELLADPRRRPQPVRDRLAVEQLAEPARRLERVAQRVAEVQRDPPGIASPARARRP